MEIVFLYLAKLVCRVCQILLNKRSKKPTGHPTLSVKTRYFTATAFRTSSRYPKRSPMVGISDELPSAHSEML